MFLPDCRTLVDRSRLEIVGADFARLALDPGTRLAGDLDRFMLRRAALGARDVGAGEDDPEDPKNAEGEFPCELRWFVGDRLRRPRLWGAGDSALAERPRAGAGEGDD